MNIAIATADGSTLASATVRTLFAAFDMTEGEAAGRALAEEMGGPLVAIVLETAVPLLTRLIVGVTSSLRR